MSDPIDTDLQKRLGKKARHITWVNQMRAGFMNPADRPDYYEQVANEKEEEEKRKKREGNKG